MWQSSFANCQILQTPLFSLEILPAKEVSLKDAEFIPNYSLKYTGQLQTSSSLLQSCWDNWGRPRSLFALPQPFNYSKIFYIIIIAVKYLHALFSKHGTSDAKNQEELATGTRGLWWHWQEMLRGNSLARRGTCGMGEQSGPTLSSGKCMVPLIFLWRRILGKKASNGSFSRCPHKGFWRQPGAAIQLSSKKAGEGNSYVLFPGWMEELVTRLEDLSRKCLKTRVWSSIQKWGPQPWTPLGPKLNQKCGFPQNWP